MIDVTDSVVLRLPERKDVAALYKQKNDQDVAALLGGFSRGYSVPDIEKWIDRHDSGGEDLVWVISDKSTDTCLGHVGLYRIEHRVASAEFAIMLGEKSAWGHGIGTAVTSAVLHYAYTWLNLHRIQLTVLETNARALAVYRRLGFVQEGRLRDAQYKDGRYVSLILMSQLRDEFFSDS